MNEQMFYYKDLADSLESFALDKEESFHIYSVLRKKEKDLIKITNGKGLVVDAEIVTFSNSKVEVEVKNLYKSNERGKISLAFSPVKKRDKNEWVVEKAIEIGVNNIYFFSSKYSERMVVNLDRFHKIAVSAIKQSLNPFLPNFFELKSFKETINEASMKFDQKLIAYCGESIEKSIQNMAKKNLETIVFIGPEGGFDKTEIEYSLGKGFAPMSLGKNRLRTETASIYALSVLNSII